MSYNLHLYKVCLPISEYNNIGFINFCQSVVFVAADLHSRFAVGTMTGRIKLPTLEEQRQEMEATRNTLCAQFIDRQQLRVQAGSNIKYYEDLATHIGCFPSIWRLLLERPTAIWHAFPRKLPSRYNG